MRTTAIALALAVAFVGIALVAPAATAEPNGFGRCVIKDDGELATVVLPDGEEASVGAPYVECYW